MNVVPLENESDQNKEESKIETKSDQKKGRKESTPAGSDSHGYDRHDQT
jgi:hypothetical protein